MFVSGKMIYHLNFEIFKQFAVEDLGIPCRANPLGGAPTLSFAKFLTTTKITYETRRWSGLGSVGGGKDGGVNNFNLCRKNSYTIFYSIWTLLWTLPSWRYILVLMNQFYTAPILILMFSEHAWSEHQQKTAVSRILTNVYKFSSYLVLDNCRIFFFIFKFWNRSSSCLSKAASFRVQ